MEATTISRHQSIHWEYFSKPTLEPTFFSFHSSKCCCDAAVEGSKSVPSKPDSPWIPGSCRGDLSNGTFWPETTFTFSTPAACNTRAALAVVCVVRSVGGGAGCGQRVRYEECWSFLFSNIYHHGPLILPDCQQPTICPVALRKAKLLLGWLQTHRRVPGRSQATRSS